MNLIKKLIFFLVIIFSFCKMYAQENCIKIDSINCFFLPKNLSNYYADFKPNELRDFSIKNKLTVHFDLKNSECIDSFAKINFSEKEMISDYVPKNMLSVLVIDIYQSNGIINTFEVESRYYIRVNGVNPISGISVDLEEWIKKFLFIDLFMVYK